MRTFWTNAGACERSIEFEELRREHAEGFDAGTFLALDLLVERLDELIDRADRAEIPVKFSLVT
ncbi:hypothetical protein [Paraburkholderia sp. UYCP14C]|uniref:hypothetical protein n=1 Tax=Paraburkholderia sp. UYCP14C TaxID=2511130 RepID=UPI002007114B|nr:hypothetical protein [Paraburkholderia sp. UYCP14C]